MKKIVQTPTRKIWQGITTRNKKRISEIVEQKNQKKL